MAMNHSAVACLERKSSSRRRFMTIVRYRQEAVSLPASLLHPLIVEEATGRTIRYTGLSRRHVCQLIGRLPEGSVTATYTVEIEEVLV